MRRITTEPSNRPALAEWMLPPPYVSNSELQKAGTERELFSNWPAPADGTGRLTVAEENVLFRQLHYAGYRLSKIYQSADKRMTKARERDYNIWTQRYHLIRTRVIEANQGLVYDLIGRSRFSSLDREEMTSEGMMALLRAADTFNPWKGYRFSTYACNAIIRAFARAAMADSKRRERVAGAYDEEYEKSDFAETRRVDERELYVERLQQILRQDEADLSEIEKTVLSKRFPKDSQRKRLTLEDIGRRLSISKERVRQIQLSAISKLREAIHRDPVLQ
ncbi:MAG: sigma-70 family RNA polymerase sigma factor [Phycisphaerales bacterium]|nr:sigma-70 family RNA polymerase sigma factor [Phycisphaerales bacterium]